MSSDGKDENWMYRQVLGRTQFGIEERQDCQYAQKKLGTGLNQPTEGSKLRMKRLLRYLAGTQEICQELSMKDGMPKDLDLYADSDYAGDREPHKNTTSVVVFRGTVSSTAAGRRRWSRCPARRRSSTRSSSLS